MYYADILERGLFSHPPLVNRKLGPLRMINRRFEAQSRSFYFRSLRIHLFGLQNENYRQKLKQFSRSGNVGLVRSLVMAASPVGNLHKFRWKSADQTTGDSMRGYHPFFFSLKKPLYDALPRFSHVEELRIECHFPENDLPLVDLNSRQTDINLSQCSSFWQGVVCKLDASRLARFEVCMPTLTTFHSSLKEMIGFRAYISGSLGELTDRPALSVDFGGDDMNLRILEAIPTLSQLSITSAFVKGDRLREALSRQSKTLEILTLFGVKLHDSVVEHRWAAVINGFTAPEWQSLKRLLIWLCSYQGRRSFTDGFCRSVHQQRFTLDFRKKFVQQIPEDRFNYQNEYWSPHVQGGQMPQPSGWRHLAQNYYTDLGAFFKLRGKNRDLEIPECELRDIFAHTELMASIRNYRRGSSAKLNAKVDVEPPHLCK